MKIHNIKTEKRMFGKHSSLKYGVYALVVAIIAIAAVNLVPEGPDSSTAEVVSIEPREGVSYSYLFMAAERELTSSVAYAAYAEQAKAEGYYSIALLFQAMADAELRHAMDAWDAIYYGNGGPLPAVGTPIVRTTAENLQTAIDNETFEFERFYAEALAAALREGEPRVVAYFSSMIEVEKVNAGNFVDALANLHDTTYLNDNYSILYRCPVCGEIVKVLPYVCQFCGTSGSDYVVYTMGTYANLYAALQGELTAYANYIAFAEQAKLEGYYSVALLFQATADAELMHAVEMWMVLWSMGATEWPAVTVYTKVGSTSENLLAAFDGEFYEYTVMYPRFLAKAQEDGLMDAARIFNFAMMAEQVHADNFMDAFLNLNNPSYLNNNFGTLYRCPVCGEVVNALPYRCPICGTSGSDFVVYTGTYANLYTALQGELTAFAAYTAYAEQARAEGYHTIALLFQATADAELMHAVDMWMVLWSMGATEWPGPNEYKVGTTFENLFAAFNGEFYEYNVMYPGFLAKAQEDGMADAARIFSYAMMAEQVHAYNFVNMLYYINDTSSLNNNFSILYRCPVCGEVVNVLPSRCPICGTFGSDFVVYKGTYANLYTALQGELTAHATYTAYAEQAKLEGYHSVALLFQATADAELKHANDLWMVLWSMGATEWPAVTEKIKIGSTSENLLAAFNGEFYEYTVMYPEFLAKAKEDGLTDAARIFSFAMMAEQVHADNFMDAFFNLSDPSFLNNNFGILYRCPVCGEVVNVPPSRCPICGTSGNDFVVYKGTYANLYAALQGEVTAFATYTAYAEQARAEGYHTIALLFQATADAELMHAVDMWMVLWSMGATEWPAPNEYKVGTTFDNLFVAFNGEFYEYNVMYPGFLAKAQEDGLADAARIFSYAMMAEQVHAYNFVNMLYYINDPSFLNNNYSTLYRCPVCGEVVNVLPYRCPICGTFGSDFVVYALAGTYANLYTALQREWSACMTYYAFMDQARAEGYHSVALLFEATAEAALMHANELWITLWRMGATEFPEVNDPKVGSTFENLFAAFEEEYYKYTEMYPRFLAMAQEEGMTEAARIFNFAMMSEQINANNFVNALLNLSDPSYLNNNFGTLYRCQVCGEVVNVPPSTCPICGTYGSEFVVYKGTYANLYAALQGELTAYSAYKAFTEQAKLEGYHTIALLFQATAEAEFYHANDLWAVLVSMGATEWPEADKPKVGSTYENLLAAFDGEYYEYSVIYPGFLMKAWADGLADAARIFNFAMKAEQVHADNFLNALINLSDPSYLNNNFGTLYRCPVCGEVVNVLPYWCPICGTYGSEFVVYKGTYANLYAALQGELTAYTAYKTFTEQAKLEGYYSIALLFQATAEAEFYHANDLWAVLLSMGATEFPEADKPKVGSTYENLLAAFDGEFYEYNVMYPGFLAKAQADGLTDAARIFNFAMKAEQVHADNFKNVLYNMSDPSFLDSYNILYRCPVCGEVVNVLPYRCPICGTSGSEFVVYESDSRPIVIICAEEVEYKTVDGIVILEPTKEQMKAMLASPGKDIIIDLSGYKGIEFRAPAEWFKDVDKNIVFITSAGSDTVKTKTLWNNSGKDRLIQVLGGKASVKNA